MTGQQSKTQDHHVSRIPFSTRDVPTSSSPLPAVSFAPPAGSHDGVDRRSAPRRPITVETHYRSQDMAFDAVIRNVSHSGLFVESDLLEPVGTPCEIVVALPNRGCRTLRGWVARLSLDANSTEPAGMGIHFVRQDGTRQIVAELMEVA